MFSNDKLFVAEQELLDWHAQLNPRARRAYRERQATAARRRSWWADVFARLWSSRAGSTAAAAQRPASAFNSRESLALLRAVARGEISPEVAQRLLMRMS